MYCIVKILKVPILTHINPLSTVQVQTRTHDVNIFLSLTLFLHTHTHTHTQRFDFEVTQYCVSYLNENSMFFENIFLSQIFAAAVFSLDGQTKSTRSKAVKNVRRHACSVLVKMCKEYPQLLLVSKLRELSEKLRELFQIRSIVLLASRASGCPLDTHNLKNHSSGHPKSFVRNF